VRQALVIVAALAFAVALWTAVVGRFGIHVGDVTIFRNRSILRPLGLAALCLVLAGRTRHAVQAMLAILVATPLSGYLGALARLDDGRPQLQELRACLRQRFGDGVTTHVYGHGDPGQWRYVYYFLPIGWDNPGTPDDGRLLRDVMMAGDYEPVLLTGADYARFRQAHVVGHNVAAVEFDDRRLLLLPGRFASCAPGN
jgi:hypothetical protein